MDHGRPDESELPPDHHAVRAVQQRGRHIDPAAIQSALLTIEAENDAMCPPGQTEAADALCPGVPETRRRRRLQAGVGHCGVVGGSRFERDFYPVIQAFIAAYQARAA